MYFNGVKTIGPSSNVMGAVAPIFAIKMFNIYTQAAFY